jgi:hypothetical protein
VLPRDAARRPSGAFRELVARIVAGAARVPRLAPGLLMAPALRPPLNLAPGPQPSSAIRGDRSHP